MVKPVPPKRKAHEQSSGNDGVALNLESADSVEILEKSPSPVESTRAQESIEVDAPRPRTMTRLTRKSKSKIPNSMQKVRQVMDRLRQDKRRQLEQIQNEIESELQRADRSTVNPWHEIFSVTKQRNAKKPTKSWIDSTHH